jgi:4-amino-4-deoxy-L-arabinose transferase-like glycosyltransferase
MSTSRDDHLLDESGSNERKTKLWLVIVLVIGTVFRIGVLIFVGKARVPWQLEFEEIANNLVEHGQYYFSFYGMTEMHPTSFIPPIYPLFLALARLLWSANGDLLVKLIQIVASGLTVLGLYTLTRELGGSMRQGLLAAFLWAVYPPAVVYASDLSTITLETFFLIPGIWLLIRAAKQRSPALAIPAGCLLALAALTRSTWLVVLPLALAWLTYYLKGNWRAWGKMVLLLGLAASVTLLPWVVYNYQAQGKVMLTSTNGGLNFWIGNNPQATGEYVFPTELDQNLVRGVVGLPETDMDQFFYAQGFEFIRNSPGEFLSLLGRKLVYTLFFRPNIGSNYESAQISVFDLAILAFIASWLALIPFALLGLFRLGNRFREHSLLLLIFFGNVATSVLYFTGTRFRTPVDGFAMIWSAIGLTLLIDKWQQRRLSRRKVLSQQS